MRGDDAGPPGNSEYKDRLSLTKLAYDAGFFNIHDRWGQTSALLGALTSNDYEMFYLSKNVQEDGSIEILAVVDQYDHKSCALYRLNRELLKEYANKEGKTVEDVGVINVRELQYDRGERQREGRKGGHYKRIMHEIRRERIGF